MKTTWALSTFKLPRTGDDRIAKAWSASDPDAPQPDVGNPVEWADATPKLCLVGHIDDDLPMPMRTAERVRPAA